MLLLSSADFFSLKFNFIKKSFRNTIRVSNGLDLILSGILSECQTVWIKIRTDSGLEILKLEFILRLKIKHNDWLLADTCPQAANHCALF